MIKSMKIKKNTTIKIGDRIMAALGSPLGGYGIPKPGTITAFTVTDYPHEKESDDNDRTEVSGRLVNDCRVIFSVTMDCGEKKWFYSDQVKELLD